MFDVDMRILIGKALKHFYLLRESLISCLYGHILLALTFKENTASTLLLCIRYRNTYQLGSKLLQKCSICLIYFLQACYLSSLLLYKL